MAVPRAPHVPHRACGQRAAQIRRQCIVGNPRGLISHFALCEYSQTFGRVGILSPSYWFAEEVYRFTRNCKVPTDTRVWLSIGGQEGAAAVAGVERMAPLLSAVVGKAALRVKINPAALHNESAWKQEFLAAARWLFDARRVPAD